MKKGKTFSDIFYWCIENRQFRITCLPIFFTLYAVLIHGLVLKFSKISFHTLSIAHICDDISCGNSDLICYKMFYHTLHKNLQHGLQHEFPDFAYWQIPFYIDCIHILCGFADVLITSCLCKNNPGKHYKYTCHCHPCFCFHQYVCGN